MGNGKSQIGNGESLTATRRCAARRTVGIAVLFLLCAGCQHARVAHPLTADTAGSDPASQMKFWHTLAERRVTSNDEAFHGLLLFLDGRDDAANYADRVRTLKSRKMLPAGFDAPADRAVERGTLAVAVCRILQIKGGVMLRVLPRSPRYAIREVEFEGIFPTSSTYQTFSGLEFLTIIGRLEDFRRENVTGPVGTSRK
jgi:hypothetical protein